MEKNALALSSFLVALVMTVLKLLVGWKAGSLGILSEAVHSAIDTIAVLMTYLAVRVSEKPADTEHTYGHGKIENLAALLQTIALLFACFWILREAVERIVFKEAHVEATWWIFAIMVLSIVVDYSRSKALSAAARKYSSQALEADAAHFTVDMIGSIVVIVALTAGRIGEKLGYPDLGKITDAIAAIAIVGITFWVSLRLGRRAFDALMDRAPAGLVELIQREIGQMENVIDPHRIRVRRSGPTIFVDMHIRVPRNLSSEKTHLVADRVEARVAEIVHNGQALVHVDPMVTADESLHDRIRLIARNHAMTIHNIRVYQEKTHVSADLHLEVSDMLDLRQAHDEASKLEGFIRKELPDIRGVNIHIEGRRQAVGDGEDVTGQETQLVEVVRKVVARFPEIINVHNIHIRKIDNQLGVYLHCAFSADATIARVHDVSTEIEDLLRAGHPNLGRIMIHAEPQGAKR